MKGKYIPSHIIFDFSILLSVEFTLVSLSFSFFYFPSFKGGKKGLAPCIDIGRAGFLPSFDELRVATVIGSEFSSSQEETYRNEYFQGAVETC